MQIHSEFDLSSVHRTLSAGTRRFRVWHKVIAIGSLVGIPTILGWVVYYGLTQGIDPGQLIAVFVVGLMVAALGGGYGFGQAARRAPGPTRLRISQSGLDWIFGDGSHRVVSWTGQHRVARLYVRNSPPAGVPAYSLVIGPSYFEIFVAYRRMLPIIPLTRTAFEGILATLRSMGIGVVTQPTSRFLSREAPGMSYVFDFPPSGPAPVIQSTGV